MTPGSTKITVGGNAYDLASRKPLPLENMSGAGLADLYNRMVTIATEVGIAGVNPVNKFRDAKTAHARIAALHSSVVAWAQGQAEEEKRLRGDGGRAESQAKIAAERVAVRARKETEAATKKAAREINPPDAGEVRGRRSDLLTLVITVPPDAPKMRAGARRAAPYATGQTVEDWVSACVQKGRPRTLALRDARYDAARGYITLSPAA